MKETCKAILLVEDDQVDAMTVRRALKELHVTNRLDHMENGEAALAFLRDVTKERPCLILLDLNMPIMNLGLAYGVVMVSLHNAAGDPIGIIAASRDFSSTRGASGRAAVSQVAGALFALIILAGVVLVAIRGFLLRPVAALARGMAALAQGDSTQAVDARGFCEELETVAESYEALRQAASGKDGAA